MKPTLDLTGLPTAVANRIARLIAKLETDYKVTKDDMLDRKRGPKLDSARKMLLAMTAWHTDMSLSEIGRRFSNRDHGTIAHALTSARKLHKSNPEARAYMHEIEKAVFESTTTKVNRSAKRQHGFMVPTT